MGRTYNLLKLRCRIYKGRLKFMVKHTGLMGKSSQETFFRSDTPLRNGIELLMSYICNHTKDAGIMYN